MNNMHSIDRIKMTLFNVDINKTLFEYFAILTVLIFEMQSLRKIIPFDNK